MGGAFIIGFFSVLSKIFGLVRERLIAYHFGASELSDVYYSSFRLPDLIYNTLILGALTLAFIPVFQKVWSKDKKEGLLLANSTLNLFLIIIITLVIIGAIFAPQLVVFFTPGFDSWQLAQATQMTRIMLLAIIFFVASNIIGGVLNSWKKFFSFSVAASFYNIGIIMGILLYPYFGLTALAWGVCLGALLHLLVQLPEAYKNGWRYRPILSFSPELKRVIKLMIPRTVGLAASQVNFIVTTMIASTLTAGSIAVFNLANNLQSLPISILAVSLAVAVFPSFTEAVGTNDVRLFAYNFSVNIRRLLFLLIPISVLMLILRAQIVRVTLGSGAFDWQATYYTAQTLGLFALSIFAQGLVPLLVRSYHAFEDSKTPMMLSIVSVVLNMVLALFLSAPLGVMGLALAFSIASIFNMLLLYIFLNIHADHINHSEILNSVLKISVNSFLAGFVAYASLYFLANLVNMRTFLGIFIQGVGAGLMGLLTYLILAIVFRLEEVVIVKKGVSRFWLFLKNGKNT